MDAAAKRRFIVDLIGNVEANILAKIREMPEAWDGHELRRYVADKFEESVSPALSRHFRGYDKRRLREYNNTRLVENL